MTIALSLAGLSDINSVVAKPSYSRSGLSAGLLHVGIGNFHRAHQGMYLHKLFEMGMDHDWAIVGAGIKHYDADMRDRLRPQDWLTTVVELDPACLTATVCGSMIDFLEVDSQALYHAMLQPDIRIVSLTVTEGGYYIDAHTGGFNHSHSEIVFDSENPERPNTVFGIMIAALMKRRRSGIPPFTVMSCDNLPGNGYVAKQALLGLASHRDDDSHDWISANVAFPNSMVDCITPATGDRERALVMDQFGIEDAAPVVCEPFRQWVLEDSFCFGRPKLEKAGAQFVSDVAPFELMKLRILNGGHATIAYPAGLMDIHHVHDAMRSRLVAGFFEKLMHEEVIPAIPGIPGFSFDAYYRKCVERFSNEAVGDTIPRLCYDGSNRQPKFILPSIEARLIDNQPVDGLALESALWCRYCYGTTDSGKMVPANDPQWDRLTTQAKIAREQPRKWLEMVDIYGRLGANDTFADAFSHALNRLWRDGTAATLDSYITASVYI